MAGVIDAADSVQVGVAAAVALAGIGISVAWLPAFRHAGAAALLARILVVAGLLAIVWDPRGLGGVLGLALTAMGLAAMWQSQPEPEVPRPRRSGILIAAFATALIMIATLRGWWLLDRLPERAITATALALGAAGAIGTLAIADRCRVRLRDAVRHRFSARFIIT